jgi:hypothetical protein
MFWIAKKSSFNAASSVGNDPRFFMFFLSLLAGS